MALSLVNINEVRQRTHLDSAWKPGVSEALRALFTHMQQLKNPDLQLVPITGSGSDEVIADAPCKLYAVVLRKPKASTTSAWFKISNHASAASANGDIVVYLQGTNGGGREYAVCFNDGLLLGTGATCASHTSASGSTDSDAADQPTGFAIIGAP